MANPSLEAFRRTVTVNWPAHQERNAKAQLIRTARAGHEKIVNDAKARGGVGPDFDVYANTPGQTDLTKVTLPGPIVYRYRYIGEIVQAALSMVRAASPVKSGQYVRSHELFVNGVRVDVLPKISAGDEVWIVNVAPYARRIEVGKTKDGRVFVLQVPDRIYQRSHQKLKQKYRQMAEIGHGFVNLPESYRLKADQKVRRFTKTGVKISAATKDRRKGSAITYPAITIRAHN
jgi:hypothetical protein